MVVFDRSRNDQHSSLLFPYHLPLHSQGQQLEKELERLTEVSANLDHSLSTCEEMTCGDEEILQRLEAASETTDAEQMVTRRYEHMMTRVHDELTKLKGGVDVITREVKAAGKAQVNRQASFSP